MKVDNKEIKVDNESIPLVCTCGGDIFKITTYASNPGMVFFECQKCRAKIYKSKERIL